MWGRALALAALALAAQRPAAAERHTRGRRDHRYEVGEPVALYANKVRCGRA